ncbi:MAG: type II toxin-antitoxin system HicA family toxin [Firmicutes bacterium]|nr:type II toxin-antitoxin system HicA family toxin [Bacillota bacterium]
MTRFEKLYAKIANNPEDVKFEELDRLLRRYGFERRQPRKGSSHYSYHHPKLPDILTIPYARPIKAVYIKQALAAIEKLKEGSE